ncbi:MAG: hypothetical protein VXY90_13980, partial [Pseudomonadota bacterium]|nr:hypothetical protein [Pseudomonadota bacterium]
MDGDDAEEAARLFASFDQDGSGEVDFRELHRALKGRAPPAHAPPAPADAAAEPKGDAPPPPPRPRAFEAPNPGSRFDQMIKDMERKYATARPVQASKRAGRPSRT